MPFEMAERKPDCLACPQGKYCPGFGEVDIEELDCDAGYFCDITSTSAKSLPCGYDQVCAKGAPHPVKCKAEEYTETMKATECLKCPDGMRCQQGSVTACRVGTFCKDNTSNYCPPGMYGDTSRKSGSSTFLEACLFCVNEI